MHVHCAHTSVSSRQQHLAWAFEAPEILLHRLGQLEPLRVLDFFLMTVILEIPFSFMLSVCITYSDAQIKIVL